MIQLVLLNLGIIAIIAVAIFLLKKFVIKSEKGVKILFIVAAVLTIVCHYSSLIYHAIDSTNGNPYNFLTSNPNLILPIYPCNVVMWCCLIYAFVDKNTKFARFLADYIFLFGSISALVGMFANVDFINNPSLTDYDVTKGIVAHGFMLFNIMIIPFFGRFKLNFISNIIHIAISILMMLIVGLYCNLIFWVLSGESTAQNVNSMFILHSPFDGAKFLTYPFIAGIALVGYFIILCVADIIAHRKDKKYWWTQFKHQSEN